MLFIKENKRRAKQQLMEKVGLATAMEDSEFQAKYAVYRENSDCIRRLAESMKRQIEFTKKQAEATAALSIELAMFNKDGQAEEASIALGRVNVELELVQLAAVAQLYEMDVLSATQFVLWQASEIAQKCKERKKLLLDLNSYKRKYEASMASFADAQNMPRNGGGGMFGRRKSEQDLLAEVGLRKMQMDASEQTVLECTEWLVERFNELAELRESGAALRSPMAAMVACQRRYMLSGADKLNRIRKLFPEVEQFDQKLTQYEAVFAESSANGVNDIFTHFKAPVTLQQDTVCFRVPLSEESVPRVVFETTEFLDRHLTTEGLFRKSGDQDKVEELRERYDAGDLNCMASVSDAHDAAALLKRFLRDLPESLIPRSFYDKVVAAMAQPEADEALAMVIEQVPEAHIICLSPLLQFLHRVSRQSHMNKMTSAMLATSLAHIMLRAPESHNPSVINSNIPAVVLAVQTLIDQAQRYNLDGEEY
ncbi:hypothetical protein BASA81_010141 [Batrachochytrium salamandrivorans]|nr:hypothetical protein BASA81_010141 [Batrachochytrium salamandrivorans]